MMNDFIQTILLTLMDYGYLGITLGLMIEIIPSEIVLSYGGFLVSQGSISFVGAVIAGTIGGTIAQIFVYLIGYYGGRPFLERYGKYIFIHKKHIELAESWFTNYGPSVIFTARFIPVVRHAISIPAGISKMSLIKFTNYTLLAVLPWSVLFVFLGMKLGSNWGQINEMAKPYIQPIAVVAVLIIAGMIIRGYMKKKKNKVL
ncbi:MULTISPECIES: DedA family protein [unclassified Peribacillus]|uniref:DedA family protein n=1 Tax=unclassified Peribacillus TaxID=2675266 RepID=UPI0036DC779D